MSYVGQLTDTWGMHLAGAEPGQCRCEAGTLERIPTVVENQADLEYLCWEPGCGAPP